MVQGFRLVKTLLRAYHIEYKTSEHVLQVCVYAHTHLFGYEHEAKDAVSLCCMLHLWRKIYVWRVCVCVCL